jgi:hypothetical protein
VRLCLGAMCRRRERDNGHGGEAQHDCAENRGPAQPQVMAARPSVVAPGGPPFRTLPSLLNVASRGDARTASRGDTDLVRRPYRAGKQRRDQPAACGTSAPSGAGGKQLRPGAGTDSGERSSSPLPGRRLRRRHLAAARRRGFARPRWGAGRLKRPRAACRLVRGASPRCSWARSTWPLRPRSERAAWTSRAAIGAPAPCHQ